MSAQPQPPAATTPTPEFAVVSAAHVPHAAAPTMAFTLSITEPQGHDMFAIALTVQIQIDPARRGYDPETRARLQELLGAPARVGPTTHSLQWARIDALVPSFLGATAVECCVPCTYDLEIASAKYFYALEDGVVPLSFHFNGTVFYRGEAGALQVVQIPWSTTAQFEMPIAAWRAMIDEHYPAGTWVRLRKDTLARLHAWRGERGLPTFDAAVAALLDGGDA
jgi:Family of unknown function (DUF6084)